jgi:hypothetical protein
MNTFLKTALLSIVFVLLLIADVQFTPTLKVGWFPEAHAILGVRRRAVRRTAIVVHSEDEANYAAQQSAAAAQQQAAAATPAPPPAPAPAGAPPPADTSAALPMGTVVQSLPDGCTSAPSGGVDYYKCGPNYYRAVFQGNSLVYVTAQP